MTFSMNELFLLVLGFLLFVAVAVHLFTYGGWRIKVTQQVSQKPYRYYYMIDNTLPLLNSSGQMFYQRIHVGGQEIFLIHRNNENTFLRVYDTHLSEAVRLTKVSN